MQRLTIQQQNIWNLRKYYPMSAITNICGSIVFREHMDVRLLIEAVHHAIKTQGSLRLRFDESSGEPMQEEISEDLYTVDRLCFDTEEAFHQYADRVAKKPFALDEGMLCSVTVAEFCGKTGILICMDHLICDAWTISLLAKQVYSAYQSLMNGLTPEEVSYSYETALAAEDKYLASKAFERDRKYWAEQYPNAPEPSFIRPETPPARKPDARRLYTELDVELSAQLDYFEKETSYSPAIVFEAAVALYLSRINRESNTASIGLIVLNRSSHLERLTAGMFVSTVPMHIECPHELPVSKLLENLAMKHMGIFRHQRYPYSLIAQDVKERFNTVNRLYDVVVSYQNARTDVPADTRWYFNGYCEVPLEVHIDQRDSTGLYTLNLDYQTEVFSEQEISLLKDRILFIVKQIASKTACCIKDVNFIPEEENNRLLYDFNDTEADYPQRELVHELFRKQAKKTPDRTALVFGDQQFSYRQLDQMSDALASYLRSQGISRGSIVPIISKRSWHILAAMLGILKAGAAYMPVDPTFPKERICEMIAMAKADLVLTYGYDTDLGIRKISMEDLPLEASSAVSANVNEPDDLCYVIFTSGSTGKPKGIALSHKNVANFTNENACFHASAPQVHSIVSVTNIIFDIFVTESLLPLLNGLTVYFADDDEAVSQKHLSRLINENSVDAMQTTPTKMRSLIADKTNRGFLSKLKTIILGGEAFPEDLARELKQASAARIFNIYGPAETTVWSTSGEVTDPGHITIGKPIANTQIYILDNKQKLLPIGVAGELCIAGEGVGKGYLNRPELTAERFIPNPFATAENGHGPMMYRTGDLARWREDGEIEYLGRIDTQVKIRGLRIELAEIESVMAGYPGILLSAVTDQRDETGRQYLAGYYTAEEEIDEKELRQYLGKTLPRYMIPNYFMRLESMPMTASGKTDRRNLPKPEFTAVAHEYVPLENSQETRLASIWSELLKIDQIGREDDFFELGGDSLLAITLLARVENSFNASLSMKKIMSHSVLRDMARCIADASAAEHIESTGIREYSLLPQQLAIYTVCERDPETLKYNMPCRVRLPEDVNRERLEECLQQLMVIHPELNTRIIVKNGIPTADFSTPYKMIIEHCTDAETADFLRPFKLSEAPLIRIALTESSLLADCHHIIMDGTSLNIVLRDLGRLYSGESLSSPKFTYGDYSAYYAQNDFSEHKKFFHDYLKFDMEPVSLPEKKNIGEQKGAVQEFRLSSDLSRKAADYAYRNHLSETMIYLAAYGILLKKYSNAEETVTGVVLTNRMHKEMQNTAGMFVNTIPMRFPQTNDVTEYMSSVRESMLNLYQYQELPYFEIAKAAGFTELDAVNTSFVFQGYGDQSLTLGNHQLSFERFDTHTSKFDLTLEIISEKDGTRLRFEYDSGKYDEKLIERLYYGYRSILNSLNSGNISDVDVVSEEEKQKLLYEFNNTLSAFPHDKCVHELFREQARKTPERTALSFDGRQISYRELNQLSDTVADCLVSKGVLPGSVIAIASQRNWRVVAAMLGIMKAGCAYLPIDTSLPAARIEYMLRTAECRLALTYNITADLNIQTIDMNETLRSEEYSHSILQVTNESVCYVLFTSGSTGEPKAVQITHRNLANYVNDNIHNMYQHALVHTCHTVLADTSFTFDISVFEIFVPLLNGLKVVLSGSQMSAAQLGELILNEKADAFHCTPTKLEMLMNDAVFSKAMRSFRIIMAGAESFQLSLLQKIQKYTDAIVFNGYGPTETTIGVSFKQVNHHDSPGADSSLNVEKTADITIGKPIANTQIYILDNKQKLLSIGVAGELCIAGEGVGKGYLNRPELTAERFIPNPFATAENGHGPMMYRTGDLARWREDGEIEYLGRIDTQVKIRGLRIELAEIESVMAGYPGILLSAVTDQRDDTGRQYLAGYYTAEEEIDEKELRQYLGKTLPRYMIPNYFMRLEKMPMTAGGKTDRRNLPKPEFIAASHEYVSPENERETKLCHVLAELFQAERFGVTDDFFEMGGDSLRAIEYVAKAHAQGVDFTLQNVFDYPTVKALSAHIDSEADDETIYEQSEFDQYESILKRNTVDEEWKPEKQSLGDTLLSGGTGFLGAHIIDAFLKAEDGVLYCLVRGSKDRLKAVLHYYFDDRYDEVFDTRIRCIIGDITDENLDALLPKSINTVIHAAASVKHFGSYDYFRKINVEGTARIADCAAKRNAKFIHISTVSVSGNSFVDAFDIFQGEQEIDFDETCLYCGQPLGNVYVRSKFEAERAVMDAMLKGLDAKIIRVGNLTNRASDLKFQPNYQSNAFLTRVKAALELGCLPDYLLDNYTEFSPVDQTAEGIILIAEYAKDQTVFHLNSNKRVYFNRLYNILNTIGMHMNILPGREFNQLIQSLVKKQETEYIYQAFQNDIDENGNLAYDSNIHIMNDFTVWFMKKTGFEWTDIDIDYLSKYIAYFKNLGYLSLQ